MFDIGGINGGADRGRSTGKPVGAVAAFDTACHQKIAVTSGMQLGRTAGAGCRDLDGRFTFLPDDGKPGQVSPGKPAGIANHKGHWLTPKARGSFGKCGLIGKGRDDPEFIDAGNVGRGDDRIDMRVV